MGKVEDALAEAEARASAAEERMRSQTLMRAEAEHRFKTSLSVIGDWAATLDDRWDQLSEQHRREGIAIVRRASDALVIQVQRLLEDARAELLVMDMEPARLDLCAMLDDTAKEFDGMADDHRVEHATAGGSLVVDVDPDVLRQVLGHLIENALKYSPADSPVVLSAVLDDGGVVLVEVSDAGDGLPDDVDVFAAFQRGAGTSAIPGVGLGLYIVNNLVRAMGGEVTSRRNDRPGTTFSLRLPSGTTGI